MLVFENEQGLTPIEVYPKDGIDQKGYFGMG